MLINTFQFMQDKNQLTRRKCQTSPHGIHMLSHVLPLHPDFLSLLPAHMSPILGNYCTCFYLPWAFANPLPSTWNTVPLWLQAFLRPPPGLHPLGHKSGTASAAPGLRHRQVLLLCALIVPPLSLTVNHCLFWTRSFWKTRTVLPSSTCLCIWLSIEV